MKVRGSNNQQTNAEKSIPKESKHPLKHQQIDDWLVETCADEEYAYDSIRPCQHWLYTVQMYHKSLQ